jgi:hypothetical protein
MDKDLNVRPKTLKQLWENTGKTDKDIGNDFLTRTHNSSGNNINN